MLRIGLLNGHEHRARCSVAVPSQSSETYRKTVYEVIDEKGVQGEA